MHARKFSINGAELEAGPSPNTPEWHALRVYDPDRQERPVVIGASEASAAMGISPYTSAFELYLKKRGEYLGPSEPTEAQEMGQKLEPIVLWRYSKETGIPLADGIPVLFHPQHSWMACTPDAFAVDGDRILWVVDAKTSCRERLDLTGESVNKYGEAGTDMIPVENIAQAQQLMAVTGLDRCDFPVLFDNRGFRIYHVDRDENWISAITSATKELAERVVNGDPPGMDFSHPGTRRIIQERQGVQLGVSVTLPVEYLEMWQRAQQLKEQIAAAEKESDALRLQVLHASGEAESVCFDGSPVRLKKIGVAQSVYTLADVEAVRHKLGQVKRRGFCYLRQR